MRLSTPQLGRFGLLLLACTSCFGGEPGLFVLIAPDSVTVWERFESIGAIGTAGELNPSDPALVLLRGEFVAPDGTTSSMPGFVTRDYTRALVGGFEKLRARTTLQWRVRFTPTQVGTWRWRWVAEVRGTPVVGRWRSFTASPPRPEEHGFLRVSPEDPRYLRFEDGSPYFAVGENLAWYDGRGSFAYDYWFQKLAASGVNYVRLWMPSWAFSIEWTRRESGALVSSSLGDYRDRLERAWQLDHVLEAAETHGIFVVLCIQNHGPFSLTTNSEWADNPYNAANGGPITTPADFFSDAQARQLFRRRLRTIVARWGYSTHILAWELWNEVDLVGNLASPEVLDWHSEMANELRSLDPYDHLVTTSSSGPGTPALWNLPELDYTQSHSYAWPFFYDFGTVLPFLMDRARVPGKPTLLAEVGTDFRGPAETLNGDPEAIGFHDALWAGVMAEAFGTGMSWWWDNLIDPEDLYFHFGAIAAFVSNVAFDRQAFTAAQPVAAAPARELIARALIGNSVVLAWIKNANHQWFPDGISGDPVPVVGATLDLSGIGNGIWRARWIDTRTGRDIATADVTIVGGAIRLTVPDFSGDVALRMEAP